MKKKILEFKPVPKYRIKEEFKSYTGYLDSPKLESAIATCFVLSNFEIEQGLYNQLPASYKNFFELSK